MQNLLRMFVLFFFLGVSVLGSGCSLLFSGEESLDAIDAGPKVPDANGSIEDEIALASLEISTHSPLVPAFSKEILEYTVEASYLEEVLVVLPVALDPIVATILVEDTNVLSGVQSGELRMNVGSNVIEIKVIVGSKRRAYRIEVLRSDIRETQIAEEKAIQNGLFGASVSSFGDYLAVGIPKESTTEKDGGGVYIYKRANESWRRIELLQASPVNRESQFGHQVSMDGDTLAVSAPFEEDNSGAVYLYERVLDNWIFQQKLTLGTSVFNSKFGNSISLRGDVLAIGEKGGVLAGVRSGVVHMYSRVSAAEGWTLETTLTATNPEASDLFGAQVSLGEGRLAVGATREDGNGLTPLDNSKTDSGAVYVFEYNGTWQQKAYLKAANLGQFDEFGSSVSLSGDVIAIGARCEDGAENFEDTCESDPGGNGEFGAAYVFRFDGMKWNQEVYIAPETLEQGDFFGEHISLSGDNLAVGARLSNSPKNSGSTYLFHHNPTTGGWDSSDVIKASDAEDDAEFGSSLYWKEDDTLLIGAPRATVDSKERGRLYLYEMRGVVP